jgi:transposase InsO family protein
MDAKATDQENMALFRYQVILPIISTTQTSDEERRVREGILEREWEYPDGSRGRVKARTLRHWLAKYRRDGLDGLFYGKREAKKTKGLCTAIPEKLLNAARELREEDSRRSVEQILQLMEIGKDLDVTDVCPRTLMRYFKRLGLRRGRRRKGRGQHERYEQPHASAMWHGDTAHTFTLPDPHNPGRVRKAKLIALIDDATRVCVHGEFYFDEMLPSVLDTVAKALLLRGKPTRILLDNAKTFRSTTLELMCAELGIGLNFCRPRRPQGKGKIERFLRTVKESFCVEARQAPNITTLEELNAAFQGWLERYGNRVHDELRGMTPEARWRQDEHQIDRSLTEVQIRHAMMLRANRTVHVNTALVSLGNREYQADRELAGQDVEIRWNPERLDQLEIWKDGRYLETAMLKERKPHVERDWRQDPVEEPGTKKLASSGEYCAALMGSRVPKAVRNRGRDDLFKLDDFIELLAGRLGREQPFEDEERELIAVAFKRLAPLERAATGEKIAQSVEEKGAGRHVRFYLERLEPKAFRR